MAKNGFRVTSIFKIIFRICKKNVEFCEKKVLPKTCLFFFLYVFYLNEKELIMWSKNVNQLQNLHF